jgi:hypothetical protein
VIGYIRGYGSSNHLLKIANLIYIRIGIKSHFSKIGRGKRVLFQIIFSRTLNELPVLNFDKAAFYLE